MAPDTDRDDEPSRSDIEHAAPNPEEAPRVLNTLVAAAQRTIEESRTLIAKMNGILAKARRGSRDNLPDE
jgi:hypothetical protein